MDRLSTKGQMVDQVDLRAVPHSGFDRSNHNFGTGKLGRIIPVRLDEVYPGDRIKGRPEMVVNFEPLVAPLMGSMVLKQESFFVPYIQLWRHAYKFFTGKNGFNEEMPSISPFDIYGTYRRYVYEFLFSNIGTISDSTRNDFAGIVYNLSQVITAGGIYSDYYNGTLYQHIQNTIDAFSEQLDSVYGSRKMLDLVQPAIDIIKRFGDSTDLKEFSNSLENLSDIPDITNYVLEKSGIIGQVLTDVFNFFQGPSSLFDYLGWPVPTDLQVYTSEGQILKVPEYGVYNIFQYAVYRNILIYGSYHIDNDANYTSLDKLFSRVPLVFNPFKAYYLVWYWNYRDQLLETDILDPDEDEFLGSTITANIVIYCTILRQRCWYKDTFTTALTNTGSGNLFVPTLSDSFGEKAITYYNTEGQIVETSDAASAFEQGATVCKINNGDYEYSIPMNYLRGAYENPVYADMLTNSANYISLDMFDRIKRLRSVTQKRLILGYEVDDVVYSSFMVKMSNVRIHIPEILGRGRDSVVINTLVNNTSTAEQIAGDKTATAYAHGLQSEMNYFSEEWGIFFTFTTIMPIQSYAGGLQRLYLKRDPLDYMWPEYATLGMDAVYNTELAAIGTRLTDEQGLQVFGYQGRYFDLKSRQDEEHGRLLTDLNYLTFSREWDKHNPPKLNYIFVHCWPRLDGFVLDSPDVDVFRYDCYNAHAWERCLPVPSEYVGA